MTKFTIPQAAKELKVTEAWVRTAIRMGDLPSTMEPTFKGSRVMKHMISKKALDQFANRDNRRASRRDDGRAKWFFYASPEEVRLMKEVMYTSDLEQLKIVAGTILPSTLKGAYLNGHNNIPEDE